RADGRGGVQRAFSENLFEAGGLLEETVAGRTSRAAVRGGAGFGHLGVAFENVALDGGGLRLAGILRRRSRHSLGHSLSHSSRVTPCRRLPADQYADRNQNRRSQNLLHCSTSNSISTINGR